MNAGFGFHTPNSLKRWREKREKFPVFPQRDNQSLSDMFPGGKSGKVSRSKRPLRSLSPRGELKRWRERSRNGAAFAPEGKQREKREKREKFPVFPLSRKSRWDREGRMIILSRERPSPSRDETRPSVSLPFSFTHPAPAARLAGGRSARHGSHPPAPPPGPPAAFPAPHVLDAGRLDRPRRNARIRLVLSGCPHIGCSGLLEFAAGADGAPSLATRLVQAWFSAH